MSASFGEYLRSRAKASDALLIRRAPEVPVETRAAVAKIEEILRDADGVPAESSLRQVWERVSEFWKKESSLTGVSSRDLRRVGWVLFYPPEEPKAWLATDPAFITSYVNWARETRRSPAISALVKSLLLSYPEALPTFETLRSEILKIVATSNKRSLDKWRERCQEFGLLDADGPERFGAKWFTDLALGEGEGSVLSRAGLDGALKSGGFAEHAFVRLLAHVQESLEEHSSGVALHPLLQELVDDNAGLRFPSLAPNIASTLLMPYRARDPEENTKTAIREFLTRHLGDPRVERDRWFGVDDESLQVIRRWLVQLNLDAFFNILDRTAVDRHWKYRREFWTEYLERGTISEAWVILGPDAQRIAYAHGDEQTFIFGRLKRGYNVQGNHSVLLMRIGGVAGGITVAEWSHNGTLRFWLDGNDDSPRFYRPLYTGNELRSDSDKGITHHGSERGTWQHNARTWIASQVEIG